MAYTLFVSHDYGATYRPDSTADDVGQLLIAFKVAEKRHLRYYVTDSADQVILLSDIHTRVIDSAVAMAETCRKKAEPFRFATKDFIVKDALKRKGIETLSAAQMNERLGVMLDRETQRRLLH